jgi:uncharacterized membrane protein
MALCNSNICSGTPFILNPGPVVAPNVDTLYGAAWLDLSRLQVLQIPNMLAPNAGGQKRYWSVTFLDMYMNNIAAITNADHPAGGLFCLTYDEPLCAASTIPFTAKLTLPKIGVLIARVWSNGGPSSVQCSFPTPPAAPFFDPDGCAFLNQLGLGNAGGPLPPLIDPWTDYKDFMAPPAPGQPNTDHCWYHYGEKPCGNSATANQLDNFYKAVCKVLTQSPPNDAEAAYINNTFGAAFGIYTTGCTTTAAQYAALRAGFNSGYAAMKAGESYLGILGHQNPNEWLYIPFDGSWSATQADFFQRAVASSRLHFLVANDASAYWAAYTDSRPPKQRTRLNCANTTYLVKFQDDSVVPIDYSNNGFWSVTVYDKTWFLKSGTSVYGVRSNQEVIPQPFYLSSDCTGLSPCVPAPADEFQLLFRGYRPLAGLSASGNYNLPKIQMCKGSKGQGC